VRGDGNAKEAASPAIHRNFSMSPRLDLASRAEVLASAFILGAKHDAIVVEPGKSAFSAEMTISGATC
jgi:hypothetical protein